MNTTLDENNNNRILSRIISGYKFVHIIYNDKFCKPIIDFINSQFDESEHVFLVQKRLDYIDVPRDNNVFIFDTMKELDFTSPVIEKVIMHSLFIRTAFDYWYTHQDIQKEKAYWMIYGGDLYDAPRNEIADTVRKGFRGYISDTDGDCVVAERKYDLKNKEYYCASYSFPIDLHMLEAAHRTLKNGEAIRIQINNSCDYSTIPMLKILEKFKDENIEIVTVLSYGQLDYKEEIIKIGKEIFGNKFSYLNDYIKPEDYAEWLMNNDIYILNQDRQQGLGNAIASLAGGKKVYIKSEITTFYHFTSRGIVIFDSNDIGNLNWNEFKKLSVEIRSSNMKIARMFYDNKYLKKCWEQIFSS